MPKRSKNAKKVKKGKNPGGTNILNAIMYMLLWKKKNAILQQFFAFLGH